MKLDRLLSRIRAALQGYATEFERQALAAEYAEACAKAAERLDQVVPLIRQGQDFPALQIAESPPPVLDLVQQLSFAEADKWRAYCLQHQLPVARPFDERSVDLVNKLYGKKISETHPLYREYRQAIRLRHEDEALRVLRSIRRVNPEDTNAQAEFARLAHKLFGRRSAALADALARHDTPRALELIESIEADALPGREQDAIWQQAQKFLQDHLTSQARARSLELATLLQQVRSTEKWREALPLLSEWDVLRNQFAFTLPEEVETKAAAVREWAAGLLGTQEKDDERKKSRQDLDDYVNRLAKEVPEKKATRTLFGEISELRAQAAALAAEAKAGGNDAAESDLLPRLQLETTRLQAQLRKRQLRAGALALAALVVLSLVLVATSWFHTRSQLRQTDLAAIQQHLKDGATNALAGVLKDYDDHFSGPESDPAMDTLLAQARDFVNSHQAVVERFDKELAQISDSATNPSPTQTSQLLASLDKLEQETAALGADDAQQGKTAVQNLRVRLNQHLSQQNDSRAARLADIAKRAAQILTDKLSAPLTAEAAQGPIADAQKILAEADSLPADPAAVSPGENEARTQLAELTQKAAALATAAHEAIVVRAHLDLTRSLDAYHGDIAKLAKNALANETSVAAAKAIFDKYPDWTDAAQRILLPNDAATWAFLQPGSEARLLPVEHNQTEDLDFYTKLVTNNVLGETYRADLVTYVDGDETAREAVALAGQPKEKSIKLDSVEEVQQTANQINADGSTTEKSLDWKQFTGRKPTGQKLENIKLTAESQLMARVRGAYSRDRGAIVQPLLRVLDDIRGETGISPIFKAYIAQEIFQIMQSRPRDWGLAFSPQAQAAEKELAKITGGHLQPADWLFPAPTSRLTANLQAFFDRTASDIYFDDAMGNLQSLLKKRATELRFAGYVDLSGIPHLTYVPAGTTLWGLDSSSNWVKLYRTNSGSLPSPLAGAPQPTRLTPLVFSEENISGGL